MSTRPEDELSTPGQHPEAIGPRRKRSRDGRGRGCLIGCSIVAGIFVLLSLAGMYACQSMVDDALINDVAEVRAVADDLVQFELPVGYLAEGAFQVSGLGELAFFTRVPDSGPGSAMLAIGRVEVEMNEEELIKEIQEARGGARGDLDLETARCRLDGQVAVCMDALMETDAEDPRIRWRSIVVPLKKGSLVLVVADVAGRFNDAEASAFFSSVTFNREGVFAGVPAPMARDAGSLELIDL